MPDGTPQPMTVELLVRQTCPRCRGAGRVDHPAWRDFWAHWLSNGNSTLVSLEDGSHAEWFKARGIDPIPPQTIPCGVCHERGRIDGTLPLADLLDILGRKEGLRA